MTNDDNRWYVRWAPDLNWDTAEHGNVRILEWSSNGRNPSWPVLRMRKSVQDGHFCWVLESSSFWRRLLNAANEPDLVRVGSVPNNGDWMPCFADNDTILETVCRLCATELGRKLKILPITLDAKDANNQEK